MILQKTYYSSSSHNFCEIFYLSSLMFFTLTAQFTMGFIRLFFKMNRGANKVEFSTRFYASIIIFWFEYKNGLWHGRKKYEILLPCFFLNGLSSFFHTYIPSSSYWYIPQSWSSNKGGWRGYRIKLYFSRESI